MSVSARLLESLNFVVWLHWDSAWTKRCVATCFFLNSQDSIV